MKQHRYKLTFFLGFVFLFSANSQIDSANNSSCLKSKIDSLYQESMTLYKTNQTGLAIKKTIEALDFSHKENSISSLPTFYILLGNLYLTSKENENAKINFEKGLDYSLKLNDTVCIYKSYNSLGNLMSDVEKKPIMGLNYYNKAIDLMEKTKDTTSLITTLVNIGWTYLDFNESDKAYYYLKKSKLLNDKLNKSRVNVQADILHLIGRYHYQKKEYTNAIKYLTQSLELSKNNHFFYIVTDVYNLRAKVFENTNQPLKAYKDLRSYLKYNDSLLSMQRTEDLEAANAKFAVAEYERDLLITKKEKNLSEVRADSNKRKLLFAIVTSLFILGLIYLYFSNKARKRDNAVLIEKNKLLQEAKEKSDHLNALKTQFISTVSHELRTPLYGIIGITNLLDENNTNFNNDQIELIGSLKESSDFLLKHINDVLKIGEIESRNLNFDPKDIDFNEFINHLKNKFTLVAKKSNNLLHIDFDSNIPESVFIDQLRLNEVIVNLLDNACKFTTNGNIWFRVKQKSKENNSQVLLFEVEDDGIGISEDKKDIIFDKFYQANRGQKNLDGTGLGLSVVKYLLRALDSEIKVESSLGKGSKFYFELTLLNNKDNVKKATIENNANCFVKKNILIAEDNKISQAITKKMIQALGHDCVVCDNGLETFKAAKEIQFDLILMDLNMPVMDGIDSAKLILEHNKNTPIVALTALDLNNITKECYSVGILCAVNKPIKKKDLSTIIDKYSMAV